MNAIIPAPAHIEVNDDETVVFDANTWIEVVGDTSTSADWLRQGLATIAGINLADSVGSGTKITLKVGNANDLMPITYGTRADGGEAHSEGYEVAIGDGEIVVTGMTPEAVFRGATSLLQRTALTASDGSAAIPGGMIADAPRLAWRGLSFDVVRCFHRSAP